MTPTMTPPRKDLTLEVTIVARRNGTTYSQTTPGGMPERNAPLVPILIDCHQDLRRTIGLVGTNVAAVLAAAETDNGDAFPRRLRELADGLMPAVKDAT